MNYRIKSELRTFEVGTKRSYLTLWGFGGWSEYPVKEKRVNYLLQKRVLFVIWITINENRNRDVLEKQILELTK